LNYTIGNIATIVQGVFIRRRGDDVIEHLLTDSRRVLFPKISLFFALTGSRHDGHTFINDLFKQGIRNFVVTDEQSALEVDQRHVNIILVNDALKALQTLAAYHRARFTLPVIGITGSNGKTIVKEWLNQLLEKKYSIARSPRSYNSQIGVPLSVWQLSEMHDLAIFEAGISEKNEMAAIAKIIKPTIGIFTNIGEAHSEGFTDIEQKLEEKLQLFHSCEILVYCKDDPSVEKSIHLLQVSKKYPSQPLSLFNWSTHQDASLQIIRVSKFAGRTEIEGLYNIEKRSIIIPFTDDASIDNAINCWCVLLHLDIPDAHIREGMLHLLNVAMRLELKKAINGSFLINDTYNADQNSLNIALDFLMQQQQHFRKTVILSDILQSSKPEHLLYEEIAGAITEKGIQQFVGIGEKISAHRKIFERIGIPESSFFLTVADFIKDFNASRYRNEVILIKGARKFQFEHLTRLFELQLHQTVLEINLNAIVHNLNQFRKRLAPSTKIMAMVKAFSYGGGSHEIASVLQFHKVDFLAVAYADEGIELRKSGISMPIMVMNTDPDSFELIIQYNLEPELYSPAILDAFNLFLTHNGIKSYPVHLEIETGMNRLGFSIAQLMQLPDNAFQYVVVKSVFTHLAGSENPSLDDFTSQQSELFEKGWELLRKQFAYPFLRHIVNSSGILRHKKLQLDMVRIGIGLYGTGVENIQLQEVSVLKSTIAQLNEAPAGSSVSYNRSGIVKKDSLIATVRIGYADGYPRALGNGRGFMLIKGRLAPTIGNVCMDMTMIDITGIPGVEEGEEIIVFGKGLAVQQVADWAGTIPYEILTGISQRVQRVYFQE